jgi:Kef-type K+ transport system membrane component KefB
MTEALLSSVMIQLIVIVTVARAANLLARRIGQAGAVGEIIAGLALGPSLFGRFFPEASHALFDPIASVPMGVISQIGLILLMFQIGCEFDFEHLRADRHKRAVAWVSIGAIATPLVLGVTIGIVSAPVLAPGVDPLTYALFVGAALSITALPILGRILREFGLTRSALGVITISSAAVNDVVGWIVLAWISAFASARFSATGSAMQIGGLIAFGAALHFLVRPVAESALRRHPIVDDKMSPTLFAGVLGLIFASGFCASQLGVFTIFGGFAAGLLFHRHHAFVEAWRIQAGQFVLIFFLPIFFTYTGLRTDIPALATPGDGFWCLVMLAAAIGGKIAPAYFGARRAGLDGDDSLLIGVMMNTRALMELIVLNVGYDLGFLPKKVFSMLVVMAVVTTLMTAPLLRRLLPRSQRGAAQLSEA